MFATPQSNPLSHFSIGGIHGLPYVSWEGAGSRWNGYCTHGSVLFPTWHRPYVALYEQVLQQHALDVAKTYRNDQQLWLDAAQNLRAPYWDWATNSVPPPEVISLQTVNITMPDGKTSSVPNPLLQYTFNPVDPSTTVRSPSPSAPNVTDVPRLISDLTSIQGDLTSSTYNLFSRVRTWPAFSNHSVGDGGSSSNSLEAIHDRVHGTVGGFDPLFFLHHANVDRMLSLWSAVNPGVWVSPGPALQGGSFTIAANAPLDNKTSLTPFWSSQTGFWASSEMATSAGLNYTYPEFNGLNLGNPKAVSTAIAAYINRQYGVGQFSSLSSAGPEVTYSPNHSPQKVPPPSSTRCPSSTRRHASLRGSKRYTDWAARIHAKKALATSPSFVGAHIAFVNTHTEQCANCREQADHVIEGFVHLNEAIAKLSGLSSFEPDVVAPYLKDNLHWRVQAVDRTSVELERLASLEVIAVSNPLTLAPDSLFPTVGETEHHHHVTHGRLGGARHAHA
ncbi:hypothetical protein BJV77DRAFT_1061440 [Russula vinacea]|nr:hypothetical protein BJV77DRAFT_1061440 [Russula vinacea]